MIWSLFRRSERRAAIMTQQNIKLAEALGRETAASGIPVTPSSAEQLSALYACVQAISESIASLPIHVYRRLADDGRETASAHPLYRVLHRRPNEMQTVPEFVETMQAHVLLRGNAYAEIVRTDGRGVTELRPIHPDAVAVYQLPSGRLRYEIRAGGQMRVLLDDEVFHLRDRSDDGIIGRSRLSRARDAVGTAIAAEEFAAQTYRNGATPSGAFKIKGALSPEGFDILQKSITEKFTGRGNARRILVLEEGMDWQQLGVSPEDAEVLESRRLSIEQIARLFRVPPPIIGDLTRSNYSNSYEMGRWFLLHTLGPWITKWEAAIERALLSETDQATHFVEFKRDAFLQADTVARYQAYATALQWGFLNPDEVRALENRNKIPAGAGQVFRQPMNTEPVGAKSVMKP